MRTICRTGIMPIVGLFDRMAVSWEEKYPTRHAVLVALGVQPMTCDIVDIWKPVRLFVIVILPNQRGLDSEIFHFDFLLLNS